MLPKSGAKSASLLGERKGFSMCIRINREGVEACWLGWSVSCPYPMLDTLQANPKISSFGSLFEEDIRGLSLSTRNGTFSYQKRSQPSKSSITGFWGIADEREKLRRLDGCHQSRLAFAVSNSLRYTIPSTSFSK